jgi:hypothetical protein
MTRVLLTRSTLFSSKRTSLFAFSIRWNDFATWRRRATEHRFLGESRNKLGCDGELATRLCKDIPIEGILPHVQDGFQAFFP